MKEKAVHAVIRGRVQGVGFRYFVLREARRLGLKGWVRNLPDGSVEVQAEGEEEDLQNLILELKQGPPMSRVDQVQVNRDVPCYGFTSFEVEF